MTSTFTVPYASRGLTEKLLYFSKEELLFLDTVWSDHFRFPALNLELFYQMYTMPDVVDR